MKFLSYMLILTLGLSSSALEQSIPKPDDKPADMSKPVQVYILMGQSNMIGFGKISASTGKKKKKGKPGVTLEAAVKEKKLYPYLIDDAGNWTERKDVRNVRVMDFKGGMKVFNNEFMTIKGKTFGPEIGIGHQLGNAVDAPVLILKSCIGNRSLGWDLLPPGSSPFTFKGKEYQGYQGTSDPSKKPEGWYAGIQYDKDIANVKKVLSDLGTYYPGATKYEVAGFFWWQGDKDRYSADLAKLYERNLVQLIKQLRVEFKSPDAKFVCATLGQTKKGAGKNDGLILDATLAVDGESGKYPEFKGNVSSVYTNPLIKGGASNSHYGGNPETYMNVGEAMGKAMVDLLKK